MFGRDPGRNFRERNFNYENKRRIEDEDDEKNLEGDELDEEAAIARLKRARMIAVSKMNFVSASTSSKGSPNDNTRASLVAVQSQKQQTPQNQSSAFAESSLSQEKKGVVEIERASSNDKKPDSILSPKQKNEADDDDIDTLEAFMAEIDQEILKSSSKKLEESEEQSGSNKQISNKVDKQMILEEEDHMQSWIEFREKNPQQQSSLNLIKRKHGGGNDDGSYNSDEEVYETAKAIDRAASSSSSAINTVEYDSDGNPSSSSKFKKSILGGLEQVDHSAMNYSDFEKDFYEEHSDIRSMTEDQVDAYKNELGSLPFPPPFVMISGTILSHFALLFNSCSFSNQNVWIQRPSAY